MKGFKAFHSAEATLAGIDASHVTEEATVDSVNNPLINGAGQ